MSLSAVPPGRHAPEEVNVIVEIPAHTGPVKYEVDKPSGAVFVDRFMATSMFYPCNYGYVPETLAEDGDPLDVLVVTPHPVLSGTALACRPIAVLNMTDEAGDDAKILAVPVDELTQDFRGVSCMEAMPPGLIQRIEHFFAHYKDLEPGKWVRLDGWGDREAAKANILASLARHREAQ